MKRYLNQQKYSECQLVTVINAAIFLGEPGVDQDSMEYERLVDFVSARDGAAIGIEKAEEYLRLVSDPIACRFRSIKKALLEGFPVDLPVWHPRTGFHSSLVTAIKGSDLVLQNFRHGTKRKKISWEKIREMRKKHPALIRMRPGTRIFSLDPWYVRQKAWYLYLERTKQDPNIWFSTPLKQFGGITPHLLCVRCNRGWDVIEYIRENY